MIDDNDSDRPLRAIGPPPSEVLELQEPDRARLFGHPMRLEVDVDGVTVDVSDALKTDSRGLYIDAQTAVSRIDGVREQRPPRPVEPYR